MLSDSESDNEDIHQFTINEHYEKAFNSRKEREELWKCWVFLLLLEFELTLRSGREIRFTSFGIGVRLGG